MVWALYTPFETAGMKRGLTRRRRQAPSQIYAGNVYWAERVSKLFEGFGVTVADYDKVVAGTDVSVVQNILGKEVDFPEYEFHAAFQPLDKSNTNNYDDQDKTKEQRSSIIATSAKEG